MPYPSRAGRTIIPYCTMPYLTLPHIPHARLSRASCTPLALRARYAPALNPTSPSSVSFAPTSRRQLQQRDEALSASERKCAELAMAAEAALEAAEASDSMGDTADIVAAVTKVRRRWLVVVGWAIG